MNAADPRKSARLQRVLSLLSDGQPRSTLAIVTGANVCAVSSCIAELRQAGNEILCERRDGLWFYQLVRRALAA